jgi:RNA 3'-terminal phosphate cyclase
VNPKRASARLAARRHLADQLMLPLALLAGGRYRTLAPTLHARRTPRS